MAGMALGSVLAARYGDVPKRAARAYAALELLVASFGLALVYVLPGLGAQLAPLAGRLGDAPALLSAMRLVSAFLLLLVPSIAIGATLPLAMRAVSTDASGFGRHLGLLYGLNTAGAVLGVLAGELLLVGALGIRGSALVAATCSVLAAAIAWLLPAQVPGHGQATVAAGAGGTVADTALTAPSRSPGVASRLLAASFASGLLLLALEVVWLRLLTLFLNDTPLAFAVVLAAVLVGIASGSALAGVALARSRAAAYAPLVAYAAGLFGFLGYLGYPSALQRYLTFDQALGAVFAVCAPLVLLACGKSATATRGPPAGSRSPTRSAVRSEPGSRASCSCRASAWSSRSSVSCSATARSASCSPALASCRSAFVWARSAHSWSRLRSFRSAWCRTSWSRPRRAAG
jgi:hypothetical protein